MSAALPTPPRSPWQWLYAAGLRAFDRRNAARAERLPVPVVSIGNLHFGGTGKTPLVVALAEHLSERGWRVAILSRGYKSKGRGVRFASRGEGRVSSATEVGDEPAHLAEALSSVPVVVSPRRAEAGRRALAELEPAPDLFLLDDGFSHLALERDLDLLLFPSADLFARGRLLPGGGLRVPLAASVRAAAVLVTGRPAPDDPERLVAGLRPFGFRGEAFAAPLEVGEPRREDGRAVPPGSRVFLVSGLARPEGFAASAREAGLEIAGELRFGDHHAYSEGDLARIGRAFQASGAEVVLTTAKDHVKLAGRLALPVAVLPVLVRPEERFWTWFDGRLEALRGGKSE